ncbi:hypothetical protein KC960_05075 [Candidatus Saccharibacteria bacterium]|nr:hypothetical protein [Candidatus Saccharibacteria bacterium]
MLKSKSKLLDYPKSLVLLSTVGLVAAFWQATERIQMLKFPGENLSCNLNPVVDCGSVLNNRLAAVFGPPNAFIGMVAFSILLAFGLQRLNGGHWNKIVSKISISLSLIMFLFSAWFFAVSLYSIGKICIFCIFIWLVSVPIGIYGLKDYCENSDNLSNNQKIVKKFLTRNHSNVLIFVYALMLTLFLLRFKDYYFA